MESIMDIRVIELLKLPYTPHEKTFDMYGVTGNTVSVPSVLINLEYKDYSAKGEGIVGTSTATGAGTGVGIGAGLGAALAGGGFTVGATIGTIGAVAGSVFAIGVAIELGLIELQRMPVPVKRRAVCLVRPTIAALEAT